MHDFPVKPDSCLTILSLLSILLVSLHVTDDIVRGLDRGDVNTLYGVLMLVVWLLGTLVLAGRRSGYVIQLLGSLLAAGMPVLHLRGKGVGGDIAASSGGFFFIWTLFALGVSGGASFFLATSGLWRLRRGQPG